MLSPNFQELVELNAKVRSRKINSNKLIRSLIAGSYFSPFRGQGLEFEEVRQYVAGDDIRKIDWRVTARSGKPHIKLFREERERKVILCHDLGKSMCFGTRGTFKSVQAAHVTALLGWCALANGNMVGGCLYGDTQYGQHFYKPSRRRDSFLQILQKICAEPIKHTGESAIRENKYHLSNSLTQNNSVTRSNSVAQSSSQSNSVNPTSSTTTLAGSISYICRVAPAGSLVVIISDFLEITEQLAQGLGDLNSRCELVIVSVRDPADTHLPSIGRLTFSDNYEEFTVNLSDKEARKKYERQALENNAQLQNICDSLNIIHIPLLTNSDIYYELFYGMKDKMYSNRNNKAGRL